MEFHGVYWSTIWNYDYNAYLINIIKTNSNRKQNEAAMYQSYYQRNRDKILKKCKAYYKEHKEEMRSYYRSYYKNNPRAMQEYSRKYYKENKKQCKIKCKKYILDHPGYQKKRLAEREAIVAKRAKEWHSKNPARPPFNHIIDGESSIDEATRLLRYLTGDPNIELDI